MADEDDKAKAEKVAAARKKVARMQKQKAKKDAKKASRAGGPSKEAAAESSEASAGVAEKQDDISPVHEKEDATDEQQAQQQKDEILFTAETTAHPSEVGPTNATNAKNDPGEEMPSQPGAHGRQPSLSVQSKMRSSDFRRTSVSQSGQPLSPPSASRIKSPPLPSLGPDGSTAPEVFRKQTARLDELEKENKHLEKQLVEAAARWKRSEEQLDEMREASADVVALREKVSLVDKQTEEINKMKGEITALQRQNSHLQTRSHRSSTSVSIPSRPDSSPPSSLLAQIDSKSATIEAMELEISNLRAQINSQSTRSESHQEQVTALEDKLTRAEASLERSQRELTDSKQALTRASEKAVREGVDKTSTETLIKSLQRQVQELEQTKMEAEKKIEILEKKFQTLGSLHKEAETRNQARLRERDKFEKDAAMLRKKLITVENENLRLREDRDRMRKREATATGHEDGLDELEDEERLRLEKKIRDLEGENFDLRRGVWKEKRRELSGTAPDDQTKDQSQIAGDRPPSPSPTGAGGSSFYDVDLIGGLPGGSEHSRRRSTATKPYQPHSSISAALASGFAAFTGGSTPGRGGHSLEFATEREGEELLSDDGSFDENAFAVARAEEEARQRVEWAREIKKKLKDWKGWRLDLVDSRYGAHGAGVGLGEIFEV